MSDQGVSQAECSRSRLLPRTTWNETETWALIRLWEDHLDQLRGEKHNAKVYDAIVLALIANGILKTRKQVQAKIDNLTQKYRKEVRDHPTGSGATRWIYFREIHRFLGSLPVNDRALVQESMCYPEETVEQIISGMQVVTPSATLDDDLGSLYGEAHEDPENADPDDVVQTSAASPTDSEANDYSSEPRTPSRKRKRISPQEKFQESLLEQQRQLIVALDEASKNDRALRERQVRAQEKLVDLLEDFLNKS